MTRILVTVPSGDSRQVKRVLVGLGIKEMVVSEVPSAGAAAAARTLDLRPPPLRPKVRIEIVAPDVRVEPIVQALLARNKTAANG